VSALLVVLDLIGRTIDEREFQRSFAAIDDRGPDGRVFRSRGRIALGCQVLDLDASDRAQQPGLSSFDGLVTVLDGRIDNRDDLLDELGLQRDDCRISDAELISRAHRQWHEGTADRVRGDFGFAVWDTRAEVLTCSRDALGIRPLYWWNDGRLAIVSSDVRAIVSHQNVRVQPNERHVCELLLGTGLSNHTDTLYKGVGRIPGGHTLTVKGGACRVERYWRPPLGDMVVGASGGDFVEELLAHLSRAARARASLRSNTRVALSGGLDSSLVLGVARRSAIDVGASSIVFPGEVHDESEWMIPVVGAVGADWDAIPWRPRTWDDVLQDSARAQYLPAYPNTSSEMFTRGGVRRAAMLTGLGGDQLMNGYEVHFTDLIASRQWRNIGVAVRSGNADQIVGVLAAAIRARTTNRLVRPRSPSLPDWLGRALTGQPVSAPVPDAAGDASTRAAVSRYRSLNDTWQSHMLEIDDMSASRAELEMRHPFLDRDLVEWALRVPDSERWHGADRRWLERRALRRVLPEPISQRRGKPEFSRTFENEFDAMNVWQLAGSLRCEDLDWIDGERLRVALGQRGSTNRDDAVLSLYSLWSILAIEAWIRTSLAP
jgi:asparagine synthase (glutamine-hydrolysing)